MEHLSVPDKRDCGVSQRAKENDHEFHELNELWHYRKQVTSFRHH